MRYDKRGVGKSQKAGEKNDKRFNEVIIIGHSEGSLIGMVVAQKKGIDKFISIAGPGLSADKTQKEQLKSQNPEVFNIALPIIDKLRQGVTDLANGNSRLR